MALEAPYLALPVGRAAAPMLTTFVTSTLTASASSELSLAAPASITAAVLLDSAAAAGLSTTLALTLSSSSTNTTTNTTSTHTSESRAHHLKNTLLPLFINPFVIILSLGAVLLALFIVAVLILFIVACTLPLASLLIWTASYVVVLVSDYARLLFHFLCDNELHYRLFKVRFDRRRRAQQADYAKKRKAAVDTLRKLGSPKKNTNNNAAAGAVGAAGAPDDNSALPGSRPIVVLGPDNPDTHEFISIVPDAPGASDPDKPADDVAVPPPAYSPT